MSEHLPECPSGQRKWQRAEAPMYGAMCICRELRACEERVWDEAHAAGFNAGRAHGEPRACSLSYKHALAAAREAVAAYLEQGTCVDCSYTARDTEILAAIDALLEDSSDSGTKVQDTP